MRWSSTRALFGMLTAGLILLIVVLLVTQHGPYRDLCTVRDVSSGAARWGKRVKVAGRVVSAQAGRLVISPPGESAPLVDVSLAPSAAKAVYGSGLTVIVDGVVDRHRRLVEATVITPATTPYQSANASE